MKTYSFFLIFAVILLGLRPPLVFAEANSTSQDSKVIVIEEGGKRVLDRGPQVLVEAGSSDISGADALTTRAARREWEQKCSEWKLELRTLNKNNLLVVDCGKPLLKEEMRQSEKSYHYESTGKYKIRVSSSNR